MKKQLLLIGITVVLIAVGLSGCTEEENNDNTYGNNDKAKFVGTWRYDSESTQLKYTFNSDGTYSHGSINGTYEIEDGKLVLHGFATLRYEYEFSDNDSTITIDLNGSGTVVWVLTREQG